MKKIIISFLSLLLVLVVHAQNDVISKLFKQYENDNKFSLISISPKMFKLMSKTNWDNVSPQVKNAASKLTGFRMLTTESNGIGYFNDAVKKLGTGIYDEIMSVKDGEENVRFFTRQTGDIINELVMIVGTKEEFVLMTLNGVIDLESIDKLGETINIKGMNNLKSVKRKK